MMRGYTNSSLIFVQREEVVNKFLVIGFLNCFCLCGFASSLASTFVDNGGTIYEAELRLTIKHTRAALREVDYFERKELATCSAYQGGKFCQYLDSLTKREIRIVQALLSKYDKVMRKKMKNLKITLTGESLKHSRDHGPWRKVQAGASPKNNSITINQTDFVSLSYAERVMLLVHELGHFIKINGRYIKDDDKIEGMLGSQLLDAIGAAVAVVGMETRNIPLKSESTESKAYRNNWFTYQVGSLKLGEQKENNSLVEDELQHYSLGYRFQFISFGLNIAYDHSEITNYISGYTTSTAITRYKLGASYKFHPFSTRADFWGHAHFLFHAGLAYNQYKHSLQDNYVKREFKGAAPAPYGEISVYFPVVRGFWITGTMGMVGENIEDQSTRLLLNQPSTYSSLGVSYGF